MKDAQYTLTSFPVSQKLRFQTPKRSVSSISASA